MNPTLSIKPFNYLDGYTFSDTLNNREYINNVFRPELIADDDIETSNKSDEELYDILVEEFDSIDKFISQKINVRT